MKLKQLLLEKKSDILTKWFDKIIDSYPADSTNFLKNQKNKFANPVGSTISEGISGLYEVIVSDSDPEAVYPFLNDIIRMKAVQGFTPSQAVSFVFLLKPILRAIVAKEMKEQLFSEKFALLESRIDEMALLSFDIFMKNRERIYEIKADEVKRMTFSLLRRANLVCEVAEEKDPDSDNVITKSIKG